MASPCLSLGSSNEKHAGFAERPGHRAREDQRCYASRSIAAGLTLAEVRFACLSSHVLAKPRPSGNSGVWPLSLRHDGPASSELVDAPRGAREQVVLLARRCASGQPLDSIPYA